jgi:hypothetical protein
MRKYKYNKFWFNKLRYCEWKTWLVILNLLIFCEGYPSVIEEIFYA